MQFAYSTTNNRHPVFVFSFSMTIHISMTIPLYLLIILILQSCSCANSSLSCRQEERDALIQFTSHIDPSFFNASESAETDCCNWSWITCDGVTRHVVKLEINPPNVDNVTQVSSSYSYYGFANNKVDDSLLQLKFLNHLDLRGLFLSSSEHCQIPEFIGSMKHLKFLDLSMVGFCGRVPYLGNLTNLEFLSLGNGYGLLSLNEPQWISRLVSLKHLDLSHVNIEKRTSSKLMTVLSVLPSFLYLDLHQCGLSNAHMFDDIVFNSTIYFPRLQYLDLSENYLQGKFPSAIQNMTSLTSLDMSDNHFNSPVPSCFSRFPNLQRLDLSSNNFNGGFPSSLPPNLKELDLSGNYLQGKIPSAIQNMTSLMSFDVSNNQLYSSVPSWFSRFPNLKHLDLSGNNFHGGFPSSLGNMSVLRTLNLSGNHLTGDIPSSLGRLQSLQKLDLWNNHFNGGINFGRLSSLEYLDLSLNNLSAPIPSDIGRNLTQLRSLFLYHNLITGPIPTSLCDMFLLEELNLADNILTGSLPNCSRHIWSSTLRSLDLRNNHLTGPILMNVRRLQNLQNLDLSNNRISGDIPEDIGTKLPMLHYLLLNDNLISGMIPSSLCEVSYLEVLDLANNNLTRNIPDCWSWESTPDLSVINLSSNNLTGVIPSSITNLHSLWSLHLNKNNLHGELPKALGNLGLLVILDLGENNLSGDVPPWSLESLVFLQILRLKDNKLNGTIPHQLCGLLRLQILDLAGNDLQGEIPSCLGSIDGMSGASDATPPAVQTVLADWSKEKMSEVLKGREMEYTKNLEYVITLDLSRNKLTGSVPQELTLLTRLDCLNLSYNALSGHIPQKIGNLKLLESLDLSNNQLSGTIPHSISDLSMLNHLNMANNNFNGRIPKGNQLDTVYDSDHSIYDGNPQLCGEPLPKLCPNDKLPSSPPYVPSKHDKDDQDMLEQPMFYMVVMLGFGTGLWGVIITLIFKKSWRAAYFRFADDMIDKVYVVVKVKVAKLKGSRIISSG